MSMREGLKALRYWVKARLAWLRLPVLAGPLKGSWISVFSGMRFIRGTYDSEGVAAFMATIPRGAIVFDVGAHVGYYAMAAAHAVGPAGKVVAFEPLPLNLRYLRGHVRANRLTNITVVAACVGERGGRAGFEYCGGTGRGRMVEGGGCVATVSIDDEVESGRLPAPDVIKMDVEGAEVGALTGAARTLRAKHPRILLSVHSPELKAECTRLLRDCGYMVNAGTKPGQLDAWLESPVAVDAPPEPVAAARHAAT